ncbi:MAG: TetR/AcrR family transcriptional regulator [Oscillospiraceae bacterium]|nr:TetR/AcrR family transcriptional regulator [Oscillospiraceae bacterium]
MPRGSEELTNARREEIIRACASLYETMSFKDITMKEIGAITSFTRTSIYNYFQTKEEIFLALLQQEYEKWIADLDQVAATHDTMTDDELAQVLASSLERRALLLKLMSMNHYDMEENSRIERLVEFKVAYGESIRAASRLLEKFRPQMGSEDRQRFLYAFLPFVYGVYPYTVVTEKQREAMEKAGTNFVYLSIYEMVYRCAKQLLTGSRS